MSQYVQRVLSALRWVDTAEENRRKDMTWAVLVHILHNMIRRPGSQTDVLATDDYIAGALDVDRGTVGDAVRRLTDGDVLEPITGTPAGQAVRDRRQSTAPLPDNARVVRLGKPQHERESPGTPAYTVNESPQGHERESPGDERESPQLSTGSITLPRRGNSTGGTNYARGFGQDTTTVGELREWVGTVAPDADVWKMLGPKTLRVYGYLVAANGGVPVRAIRDELCIGHKRAKDLLVALESHGLAQRVPGTASDWMAGPYTPSDLSTPHRATQPQQSASLVGSLPDLEGTTVNDCPDCLMWNEHGLDCQSCQSQSEQPAVTHSDRAPTPKPSPAIGWDDQGQPLAALPGTGSVWQPREGAFGRTVLDEVDGCSGKCIRANVPKELVPSEVWAAYRHKEHHDNR